MRDRPFGRRICRHRCSRDRDLNHPGLIEKTLQQVLDTGESLSELRVRWRRNLLLDVVQ
jgi:hypothetical protein